MKLTTLLLVVALATTPIAVAADSASQTLTGTFTSGFQDRPKTVRAVFEPADEGNWKVTFYFKFNGQNHEYRGTAEGSIGDGGLTGEVVSDGGRQRTFTFAGEFDKKGNFKGTHSETTSGNTKSTGKISLKG